MATVDQPQIKTTLGNTESGNNYSAERTNKDGRSFTGKYQFGLARLKDLGLGNAFSYDQYNSDPAVQEWVMDRHIEDIDNYINKQGLSQYEGKTIGGIPINRNAMYAMAHLGGKGGMQKFLTSGGKYNPKDELGTSLADYATTHGGPTMAAARQQSPSKLDNFAIGARKASDEMTNIMLGRNMEGAQARAQSPDVEEGMSLPITPGDAGLRGMGQTPLSFGSTVQNPGDPFAAMGVPPVFNQNSPALSFPSGEGAPSPAAPTGVTSSGGPAGGLSFGETVPKEGTSGEEEPDPDAEEQKLNFMDKIAGFLFPNKETQEDKTSALKKLIGGIGTGLGQMSAGQPVNLNDYFARIAGEQQAMIDAQLEAEQAAIDNQLGAYNAETARAQAEVAAGNLKLNQAKLAAEGKPFSAGYSSDQLTEYGQDPQLKPFVDMIASGVEDTVKAGVQGLKETLVDRAKNDPTNPDSFGDLMTALDNDAPMSEIADIVNRGGMEGVDVKRAYDMLGKTPTADSREIDEYLDAKQNDPARAKAMEDKWQRQIGVDETPRQKADRERAYATADEFGNAITQSAPIYGELLRMEDATKRLIDKGMETGPFNDFMTGIYNGARQLLGVTTTEAVSQALGYEVQPLEALDQAESTLALLIAQPLMEGGGSISDSERKAMLRTVAQGGTTHEQRLEMIERLKAMHMMDRAMAKKFGDGSLNGDYSNARNMELTIKTRAAELMPQISRAQSASAGIRNMNRNLPGFSHYKDMTKAERVKAMSVPMRKEDFQWVKDTLPKDSQGRTYWARENDDGTVSYMLDDLVIDMTAEGINK